MPQASPSQIDIFAAVARSGSVDRGARSIGLPADDVAGHLRVLEKRMGHRLLETAADGGLRLTAAGQRTLEALQMLAPPAAPESRLGLAADRPAQAPAFRVVLATHPSIFSHFRDQLSDFEACHPDAAIDLDLQCFTDTDVAQKLGRGGIDIAYYYAMDASEVPASEYMWSERLSILIGTDHPLASEPTVSAADLALVPPILFSPANPLRGLIDSLMTLAGLGAAPPACESDDYNILLEALRTGRGFLPSFGALAQQMSAMPDISSLPFAGALPALDVRCAITPAIRDHPLGRDLLDALR